jgi:hypothetical protein
MSSISTEKRIAQSFGSSKPIFYTFLYVVWKDGPWMSRACKKSVNNKSIKF